MSDAPAKTDTPASPVDAADSNTSAPAVTAAVPAQKPAIGASASDSDDDGDDMMIQIIEPIPMDKLGKGQKDALRALASRVLGYYIERDAGEGSGDDDDGDDGLDPFFATSDEEEEEGEKGDENKKEGEAAAADKPAEE